MIPCLWDFSGKNTGVCCHFLLQEIFPTQGSNILYPLSHQETWPGSELRLMDKAPFSSHVLCSHRKIEKLFSAAVLLKTFFSFSLKEKNAGGVCQRRLFNHTLPACLSTRLNWGTVLNSLKQDPPYSFQSLLKCRSMQGIAVSQLVNQWQLQ